MATQAGRAGTDAKEARHGAFPSPGEHASCTRRYHPPLGHGEGARGGGTGGSGEGGPGYFEAQPFYRKDSLQEARQTVMLFMAEGQHWYAGRGSRGKRWGS